ncbi:MAG TPA: polymer-forming cytoskeletal protein [Longimicrobiales bacterium]|nr:polymer-forming cytoskeletal protein [Longimicrobiales bacterium]
MWKKDEGMPAPSPTESSPRTEPARRSAAATGERATIGRSITIRGEVSGDEDLLIQGRIDGSIDLEQHSVTVGKEGRVKANITGRVVTVEGHVDGDLTAQEQIILRASARVQGDIKAPRVVLEDGAAFKGLVDMAGAPEVSKTANGGSASRTTAPTAGTAAEPAKGPTSSSTAGSTAVGASSSARSSASSGKGAGSVEKTAP